MTPHRREGFQPVMMLFEGICPTCNAEVEIIHIGGFPSFFDAHPSFLEGEHSIWTNPDRRAIDGSLGEVTWKCTEGHTHMAGQDITGDWNL